MPTEMLTKDGRKLTPPIPTTADPHGELREFARKHLELVRRFKMHIAAFLVGMAVLTPIWAFAEWQSNGGFERWSDNSNPGDWEPWILYVATGWGLWLVYLGIKVYFDRPTTEADIDREVERLIPRG